MQLAGAEARFSERERDLTHRVFEVAKHDRRLGLVVGQHGEQRFDALFGLGEVRDVADLERLAGRKRLRGHRGEADPERLAAEECRATSRGEETDADGLGPADRDPLIGGNRVAGCGREAQPQPIHAAGDLGNGERHHLIRGRAVRGGGDRKILPGVGAIGLQSREDRGGRERVFRRDLFRLEHDRLHRGLRFLQLPVGRRDGGLLPRHAGLCLRIVWRGGELLLGGCEGRPGRLQIAARRGLGDPATIGLPVGNAGGSGIDAADPRGELAARLDVPRGQFRGDQLLGSQARIEHGHPVGEVDDDLVIAVKKRRVVRTFRGRRHQPLSVVVPAAAGCCSPRV